ncbi:MAG: division/cell wall cluster transcriptional repressor MraZ [Defluviitaleaceae bacterium]|nr:division/cell wall cluster transcriptional repressor MraZ [Defluviitaleaceae bacterium]
MFLGEYQHSVDTKGRIIMPSKFREQLCQTFIITKGLDKCLLIYTQDDFNILNEKVKQLPVTDEGVRRFVRFFFGGAAECECDAQGRANIPQNLREYAGIQKDVISIGVSNRIEMWSRDGWESYNGSSNTVDEMLAEKMTQLGI